MGTFNMTEVAQLMPNGEPTFVMSRLELLNYLANRPEIIRELAPGYATVDLEGFFDEPRNVMLGDENGVVLFGAVGRGVYQMHYLLTDELRGPAALAFIKSCLREMFTNHGAVAITGQTPRSNRAARAVNRALGGRPIGESTDSHGRPCLNYLLERETWATSLAELSAASAASSEATKAPSKP
jgi:hypothetical protein